MIKKWYSAYKNILLAVAFVILPGLIFASLSFAKDNAKNDAVTQTLALADKKQTTEKPEPSGTEKKSFKRFEITYESINIKGKFWEETTIQDAAGIGIRATINYKNKVANRQKINTGVYKLAFFFTPKTYVEGGYAATVFNKKRPGYLDLNSNIPGFSATLPDHINAKDIKFWSADFFQNIYTHKKTGIGVDAFAGYAKYKLRVKVAADVDTAPDMDLFGGDRTFAGIHYGLRFKAPFKLPALKKFPFIYKLQIAYTPIDIMKGGGMYLLTGLINEGFTSKGKGDALEIHTAFNIQLTSFLSLEAAYNYYQFKVYKGRCEDVALLGIPLDVNIDNTKIIIHGPSIAAKVVF